MTFEPWDGLTTNPLRLSSGLCGPAQMRATKEPQEDTDMSLSMDNRLTITGPNTTAVIEALNGGQHTGDYFSPTAVHEVYFDPERIIPTPEGLDEVRKDEMGRNEQDMWRIRNWGAYHVYRDSQDIDTATSGKAVIDFHTLYGPADSLIAALSSKFPDHQFLLWFCPENYSGTAMTSLFVNGACIETHDPEAEDDDRQAKFQDATGERRPPTTLG